MARVRTSNCYIGTFDRTEKDKERISSIRKVVSEINRVTGKKLYVKLQGRLGKNNPAASKYKNSPKRWGRYQCIRLEDSAHFDAYVYVRR